MKLMEELLNANERDILISVVVPIFNAAEYLDEALDSLRRQSHTRFEAILVDDGSTDGSIEKCRRYAETDSRFHILTGENRGVSAARNLGIENASGDWIVFMDADDMYYPESLRPMLEAALRTEAQIVAGRYTMGARMRPPQGDNSVELMTADEAIITGLYQKQILNNPWGMLFKASYLRCENAPRFRDGRYEDLDFFYRVFERVNSIAILNLTVYFYRDNPNSFIHTWSAKRLDVLDVTDRIVAHYSNQLSTHPSESARQLLKAARDRRFSAHYNILLLLLRHKVDNPAVVERCLNVIKQQRLSELTDGNVRLKNKLGALLSYGGLPMIKLLSKY